MIYILRLPLIALNGERGSLILTKHCLSRPQTKASLQNEGMKIFRALGLAIGIITLKLLIPQVFSGLEHTLITFFDTTSTVLSVGKDGIVHGLPAGVGFFPQILPVVPQ